MEQNKLNENVIELLPLMKFIYKNVYLLFVCIFAGGIIGYFYAINKETIYENSALIYVENNADNNNLLNLYNELINSSKSDIAKEISILYSANILEGIINKYKLNINVISNEYFAKKYYRNLNKNGDLVLFLKENSLTFNKLYIDNIFLSEKFIINKLKDNKYELLFNDTKNKVKKVLLKNAKFNINYKIKYENMNILINIKNIKARNNTKFVLQYLSKSEALKNFKLNLNISNDKDNLILLTLKSPNMIIIPKILNDIIKKFIKYSLSLKAKNINDVINFLKEQSNKYRNLLKNVENKLNDFKKNTGNFFFNLNLKTEIENLKNIDEKIYDLEIKKSKLQQVLTDENLTIKEIENLILMLKKYKEDTNNKLKVLPEKDQIIINLEREISLYENSYKNVIETLQKYEIIKFNIQSDILVIDYSYLKEKKIGIKKSIIIILSLIFGFLIAFIIIVFKFIFYKKITDIEDLQDNKIYCMGKVSKSNEQKNQYKKFIQNKIKYLEVVFEFIDNNKNIYLQNNLESLKANIILKLREKKLHNLKNNKKKNVLTFSSFENDTGKTFISTNIAYLLSKPNNKIIFIDLDVIKGDSYKYFDIGGENNRFYDYLNDKTNIKSIIQETRFKNIDFVNASYSINRKRGNSALLLRKKLIDIIYKLADDYDFVVIDTSSIHTSREILNILQYASSNIIVSKYNYSSCQNFIKYTKDIGGLNINVDGFILNQSKENKLWSL